MLNLPSSPCSQRGMDSRLPQVASPSQTPFQTEAKEVRKSTDGWWGRCALLQDGKIYTLMLRAIVMAYHLFQNCSNLLRSRGSQLSQDLPKPPPKRRGSNQACGARVRAERQGWAGASYWRLQRIRSSKEASRFISHRAKFRFKYQREKAQTLSYEKIVTQVTGDGGIRDRADEEHIQL